ncbi:MAG: hypothetical protein HQL94_10525 [Magnetococcales bacterium]|nr:hypothetical protein [Magnetococcales bacterium]
MLPENCARIGSVEENPAGSRNGKTLKWFMVFRYDGTPISSFLLLLSGPRNAVIFSSKNSMLVNVGYHPAFGPGAD